MEIYLSGPFKKDYKRIKDRALRERVFRALVKLGEQPRGKSLKYGYKSNRKLRVDPFRIIYTIEKGRIEVKCFEHRSTAYRKR